MSNAINGQVQFDQSGNILFTPDLDFIGEATFNYTLSDNNDQTDTATVRVNVLPNNQPNEITGTTNLDTLNGTPDNDIITGLLGADTLTGNGGSDIFVYEIYRF